MGKSGNPDTDGGNNVVEIEGGLLTFKVGIGGQDDFLYGTVMQTVGKLPDSDVTGANAFGRGDGTVEYVIEASVDAGMLYCQDVLGLLNDADRAAVALLAAAELAGVDVSYVVADGAERYLLLDLPYGVGEEAGLFAGSAQQIVGDALSTLGPDAGQLAQFLDEPVDGISGRYGTLIQCKSSRTLVFKSAPVS